MAIKVQAADVERARPWMNTLLNLALYIKRGSLPLEVEQLVYWNNVPLTTFLFCGVIVFSILASCYSIITVLAWTGLTLLLSGAMLRLSKNCRKGKAAPCGLYRLMELNFQIPPEKAQLWAGKIVQHLNVLLVELRGLFRISSFAKSLKFGGMLLSLTYMGSWMNGLSLFLMHFVYVFSVPKLYEINKDFVDTNLAFAIVQVLNIFDSLKWFNQAAEQEEPKIEEQQKPEIEEQQKPEIEEQQNPTLDETDKDK